MKSNYFVPKVFRPVLKFQKASFFVILLVLTLLMVMGCQPKLSAKETFDRVQQSNMANKTIGFNIDGTMSMNMDDGVSGVSAQDPTVSAASTISNMLKDVNFKMSGYFEKSDKIGQLELAYDMDLNGMAIHIEAYFDDEKLVVKYPMMPQFLVMDVDKSIEMLNEKTELDMSYDSLVADYKTIMSDWYPEYLKAYLSLVGDKDVELIDKYVFTVDGKKVTSKALRLKFSPELVVQSNKALFDSLVNSEKMYDLVKKYDTEGVIASFEDYQKDLKEILKQLNMNADDPATQAAYENMKMDYVVGYDKDFRMTYVAMTMDMTTEDPTFGKMNMMMDLSGAMTYDDKEIKFPELNETNQMDMLEMFAPVFDAMNQGADVPTSPEATEGTSSELTAHLQDVNSMSVAIGNNPELDAIEAILSAYYKKHELEIARICFTKNDKSIIILPPTEFPADYDPTATYEYETAINLGMYAPEPYEDFKTNRMIQHIAKPVEASGEVIGVIVLDYFVGE